MSTWNLEGMYIEAVYVEEFPIKGKVTSSRVKYGGGVQHTVILDAPITVYGSVRERVLIDHETVLRVADSSF